MTSLVQTFDTELRFLPMKEIAPTMPVSDMDAAKQFYVSKLGFNVIFDRAPVICTDSKGTSQNRPPEGIR